MEYKQIQELIKTINKSNISELTIEQGDFKITIKQEHTVYQPAPVVAPMPVMTPAAGMIAAAPVAEQNIVAEKKPVAPEAATSYQTIKSPMIGTFYRSPAPDKPVFVNVGDEIKPGQVLCIIEAMKLFNEIESEVKGRIVKVLADDSTPVEYDQPLFLIEPIS
jgi:acetyl-CoA carboxylase biotin carboxyl carrier protein